MRIKYQGLFNFSLLFALLFSHTTRRRRYPKRKREREREREELRGKRREPKGNERCPRIEFVSKGCLECLRETKKKIHTQREREKAA